MFFKKKPKQVEVLKGVGGIPFFVSLACLLVLSSINSSALVTLFDVDSVYRWRFFAAAAIFGAWAGHVIFRNEWGIFIHELKHSIVSNLAGNKLRALKVNRRSGHFHYEYYRHTEKYNGLISLAPYFLPLFTAPALFSLLLPAAAVNPPLPLVIIGFAYGADLMLNLRGISRAQSDITNIRGGFAVGLLFIAAMNVVLFTYLAAWVTQGWFGLQYLFGALSQMVIQIVAYYWTKP